ncbi:class I lanthipeptide [Flavobacterium sp.]|uniref:class I lanthipeptide n=1 Tax=Flavobacterium sp. TaxID=239 RepID=UPI0037525296
MKKQNAMNKLAFTKAAVTELNGTQLSQINGGTSDIFWDTDITLLVIQVPDIR